MKILKEGTKHMANAWFHTCDVCESELRIIEGDPLAGKTCYNCDAQQYYIRYICPVCGGHNVAYTNSLFGEKANAVYREITLTKEDREEIDHWAIPMEVLGNKKDMEFLANRNRI